LFLLSLLNFYLFFSNVFGRYYLWFFYFSNQEISFTLGTYLIAWRHSEQGRDSQNFLRNIRSCLTSRCFCKVVSGRASVFDFYSSLYQILIVIILILKMYLTSNKIDLLMLKVTKILRSLLKKFCESLPRYLKQK
jgi:hypothetical protein